MATDTYHPIKKYKIKLNREMLIGLDKEYDYQFLLWRLTNDFIDSMQLSKDELLKLVNDAWDYSQDKEQRNNQAKLESLLSQVSNNPELLEQLKAKLSQPIPESTEVSNSETVSPTETVEAKTKKLKA